MISEQDNSPEAVKGRVRSITKAIRYKAKKRRWQHDQGFQ